MAGTGPLHELLSALERYPSLFSLGPDAVGLYAPDGSVIVGNAASRALLREDFAGYHSGRHLAAGQRERADAQFKNALSGTAVEFDAVLERRDGTAIDAVVRLVPALSRGTIVGVMGSARDITLRRQAEASRDESRQQFLSLFEQHPDSISMIDAAGRYVRLNAAAVAMLGYSSDEVAGRMVGEVYPPGPDRAALDAIVRGFILAGKPTRYQRTLARKDGIPVALEGTAVPIVVGGKITGIFLLSRDVTARERLHEALALAARRVGSLYRLASGLGEAPVEQAKDASRFMLKELGFETNFVVSAAGDTLRIEGSTGIALSVDAGDPLLRRLIRETIASSALLELDEAALATRVEYAGAGGAFCRSFLALSIDVGNGVSNVLAYTSRSATAALTAFDREFVRAVAEFTEASIVRMFEENRLRGLANLDALTSLPNRLLLADRFTQAIATSKRRGENVAVYYIDVDKFKSINDAYGHDAGDAVLRIVAGRLLAACRASDTVARLGGDEFIVLRSGPTSGTRAEALAARLHAAFEAPCEIAGVQLKVNIGIGISVYPQDGGDQATLLERADVALYAAKARGAGSIRRFEAAPRAGGTGTLAASLERRFAPATEKPAGAARPA